jgi:hypothetical protein
VNELLRRRSSSDNVCSVFVEVRKTLKKLSPAIVDPGEGFFPVGNALVESRSALFNLFDPLVEVMPPLIAVMSASIP